MIIILYVAFSYLFMLGYLLQVHNETGATDLVSYMWLILSPLLMPIALGTFICKNSP